MAKKARKKSKTKAKKARRARARTKVRAKAKPKRAIGKKRTGAPRRKAKPKGLVAKIASAYHTVVDTVRGTDALRNKMEPRATSGTE